MVQTLDDLRVEVAAINGRFERRRSFAVLPRARELDCTPGIGLPEGSATDEEKRKKDQKKKDGKK